MSLACKFCNIYIVETSAAEPDYVMMHELSPYLEFSQQSPQTPPLIPISPQLPQSPVPQPQPPVPQPQPPVPQPQPRAPQLQLPVPQPQAPASNCAPKKRKVSTQDVQKMQIDVLTLEKMKLELEIENIRLSNKKRDWRLMSFWQDSQFLLLEKIINFQF